MQEGIVGSDLSEHSLRINVFRALHDARGENVRGGNVGGEKRLDRVIFLSLGHSVRGWIV